MASVIQNCPSNLLNPQNDCSGERKKEEEGVRMVSERSYHCRAEPKDLTIEDVDADDYNYFATCDTAPLIEVSSVKICPEVSSFGCESFLIYGQIYVEGSDGETVVIYNRPKYHPDTITSLAPSLLLLTTPESAVIKMDGRRTMFINLKVQVEDQRDVCFAMGHLWLTGPRDPGYHQNKSRTLRGNLGDVKVSFICMPFAEIAKVFVTFTQDSHVSDTISISGKITAHYDSHISHSPLILFHEEHAPVRYGVPVNLCRSLVCMPFYSSISLNLNGVEFVDRKGKHKIDISEDVKFSSSVITYPFEHKLSGNLHVTVEVDWLTTYELEVNRNLWGQNNLSSIAKSVSPKPIEGDCRIQVLSVFVGHGGNEQVDICGTVAVDYSRGTCYLFKADNGRPRTLIGKALTLEGLTSYPGDCLSMVVRLNDVRKEHVDIKNCFAIYDFVQFYPGKWFNGPLCNVLLGKQGFAAVHFILFESAVKATVKISVVLKDSDASCPSGFVNGTLLARYSNLKYSTKYQRKYWSIDLLQVKDEQSLSEDGEISLLRDVVSVPEDSSLILYADLYVTGSAGTCVDHFVKKVEIRIGDHTPSRIKGQTYDVVVRTKWESGGSQ